MEKKKTYSIRFETDQIPSKWLEKQGNKTLSLEILIRAAVKKYGLTDLPSEVISSVGLSVDGDTESANTPEAHNSEPSVSSVDDDQKNESASRETSQKQGDQDSGNTVTSQKDESEDTPKIDLGMLTNLK